MAQFFCKNYPFICPVKPFFQANNARLAVAVKKIPLSSWEVVFQLLLFFHFGKFK